MCGVKAASGRGCVYCFLTLHCLLYVPPEAAFRVYCSSSFLLSPRVGDDDDDDDDDEEEGGVRRRRTRRRRTR